MKNQGNFKFDLIENAKDSLAHAVEHLTKDNTPDASDLKRVILDIAHVIELILKERIRKIHPAFIWENVDQYPSSDARTISTTKAVERLKRLEGIVLSKDLRKTLISCRKIRNQIEHFEFEIKPKELRVIIGRLLSFIFEFANSYLNLDLEEYFRRNESWASLINVYEFWKAHSDALEKKLAEEGKPTCECPSCGAITFDPSVMECALCSHSEELFECDSCHKLVSELETETFDIYDEDERFRDTSYSVTICKYCIKDSEDADMWDDY